jgi:hypothetical protein
LSQTGSAPYNYAPRKIGAVMRASKGVLHKLHIFVELLHVGVSGAVPNTP